MEETTRKFVEQAWWLEDDEYQPLKAMLLLLAREIDNGFQTSTVAEFGRAYRHALNLKPDALPVVDPLDDLLMRADAA